MYAIAIDGPASAGKGTTARTLAKELGFIYFDTGAMYRGMAIYLLRKNISGDDGKAISEACPDIDISIEYKDGEQQIILNGENVTSLIRTEEVGMMASSCSRFPAVREKLLSLQRQFAKTNNVVMEGRDIGTCVLPDADLKIYLTATPSERAKRRHKELQEKGTKCNLEDIEQDIIARDKQDMGREISPLKQAPDAKLVDNTDMTINEVINIITSLYHKSKEDANHED